MKLRPMKRLDDPKPKQKKRRKRKTKVAYTCGAKKDTAEFLDKFNYRLQYSRDRKPKYEKERYLILNKGYDFLENYQIAKEYVKDKHEISDNELNSILYLAPKNYFQNHEYSGLIRFYKFTSVNILVKKELVQVFLKRDTNTCKPKTYKIYSVSAKGRAIIMEFYKCISGEKKLEEKFFKVLNKKDEGYIEQESEKKQKELIKKFNQLPVVESKRDF